MFSSIDRSYRKFFMMLAAIGVFAIFAPSTYANPWSWTLGDARSVQHRTKDIADRLNREFPYCQATLAALQMDNAACQMVDAIKCGASWEQVQTTLSRTCALAGLVNDLANADCHVRNDRRTRDYINDLSKRMERLRCNLDKAFAKTQPKFCPPPIISNRPSWRSQEHAVPYGFPRDTYELDAHPRYEQSAPFGDAPEALPPGRPVGPTQYRVERYDQRTPRTAEFIQLGLQAIKLIADNR